MKSLKLVLVMAIAASSFTTVTPKMKLGEWVKKHKKLLVAGIVATAAVGAAAIALSYHGNKVQNAINKANIGGGKDENLAIAIVGLLGPIGEKRTLTVLKMALDKDKITKKELAAIFLGSIGSALAYYFGVSPTEFKGRVTAIIGVGFAKTTARELQEGWTKFKKLF